MQQSTPVHRPAQEPKNDNNNNIIIAYNDLTAEITFFKSPTFAPFSPLLCPVVLNVSRRRTRRYSSSSVGIACWLAGGYVTLYLKLFYLFGSDYLAARISSSLSSMDPAGLSGLTCGTQSVAPESYSLTDCARTRRTTEREDSIGWTIIINMRRCLPLCLCISTWTA